MLALKERELYYSVHSSVIDSTGTRHDWIYVDRKEAIELRDRVVRTGCSYKFTKVVADHLSQVVIDSSNTLGRVKVDAGVIGGLLICHRAKPPRDWNFLRQKEDESNRSRYTSISDPVHRLGDCHGMLESGQLFPGNWIRWRGCSAYSYIYHIYASNDQLAHKWGVIIGSPPDRYGAQGTSYVFLHRLTGATSRLPRGARVLAPGKRY